MRCLIWENTVNAFEQSGLVHITDLEFCGESTSLTILKNYWEADYEGFLISDLRTNIYTLDHFLPKNTYSRMCVHLAEQTMSQSTIHILRYNAEKYSEIIKVEPYIKMKE